MDTVLNPGELEYIKRKLPAGAKRALIAMTHDWQFPGNGTFNANGAHALAHYDAFKRRLAETERQQVGRYWRSAYRLTEAGAALKDALTVTKTAIDLPSA